MDDMTLRVLEVLDRHPRLDELQVASSAEVAVSAARRALAELEERGLVEKTNGLGARIRYRLRRDVLNRELQTAG